MTFSIVARDPETGDLGIAVASKFLAVGSVVPHANAGIGAVATQSAANYLYGPDGLGMLAGGASAEEAVRQLTDADDGRDERQLGIVDARGGSATYTGSGCMDWAGGLTGPCFAAQGNILVSEATVAALADAFTASSGQPLAQRLVAALAAAQAAGGDRRGQQSAALLVVERDGGYGGLSDVVADLRVDDHPAPVAELARLLELHGAIFGKTPRDEW